MGYSIIGNIKKTIENCCQKLTNWIVILRYFYEHFWQYIFETAKFLKTQFRKTQFFGLPNRISP